MSVLIFKNACIRGLYRCLFNNVLCETPNGEINHFKEPLCYGNIVVSGETYFLSKHFSRSRFIHMDSVVKTN